MKQDLITFSRFSETNKSLVKLTSHICSWKNLLSFSISSAISAPLISVLIIPCCLACSFFSFSILVLAGSDITGVKEHTSSPWQHGKHMKTVLLCKISPSASWQILECLCVSLCINHPWPLPPLTYEVTNVYQWFISVVQYTKNDLRFLGHLSGEAAHKGLHISTWFVSHVY